MAGDYAELAKRFVGFVPEDRQETLLGVTATKRAEIPAIPTCPLPQPEPGKSTRTRTREGVTARGCPRSRCSVSQP